MTQKCRKCQLEQLTGEYSDPSCSKYPMREIEQEWTHYLGDKSFTGPVTPDRIMDAMVDYMKMKKPS